MALMTSPNKPSTIGAIGSTPATDSDSSDNILADPIGARVLGEPVLAVRLEEMDANVTFAERLDQTTGPVILINTFSIDPSEAERFLEIWGEDAAFMKRQPGFISPQLHRGIASSGAFVNIAVWESAA